MEIFSVILMLLLIPLLCLLAPVFLVGLLGVMVAFALKRGQRIYVEVPRQPTGKRKNDHHFFQHDNSNSGPRGSDDEYIIVDEDGNPYRS